MLTNSYIKWLNGNIAPAVIYLLWGLLATIIAVFWMSMDMIDSVEGMSDDWSDKTEDTKDDLKEAVAGFGTAIVLVAVLFLWRGKRPEKTVNKGVFVN
tara:strand:+ start:75 stop:368 length:294 start_codon:yes stop_codon:yes gene_type:complete